MRRHDVDELPAGTQDLESLEGHWRRSSECSENRNVNNPTQTKYDVVDREAGLRLVDREDRDA